MICESITYDAVLVHNVASRANLLANGDTFILRLLCVNTNEAKRRCYEGARRKANHFNFCENSTNNVFDNITYSLGSRRRKESADEKATLNEGAHATFAHFFMSPSSDGLVVWSPPTKKKIRDCLQCSMYP